MAYLLFVDESGHDRQESPYEVLVGVSVEDRDLWNLIQALQQEEERQFGLRYTARSNELKAKKLLKRKTFRLAHQLPPIHIDERRELAKRCINDGANAGIREITALAQSKLAFVEQALTIATLRSTFAVRHTLLWYVKIHLSPILTIYARIMPIYLNGSFTTLKTPIRESMAL